MPTLAAPSRRLQVPGVLLLLAAAGACGEDPILERADREAASEPTPSSGSGSPPQAGTPGAPAPGIPQEPAPGVPGTPPPGEGYPASAEPAPEAGPVVTIHGEVRFPGWTRGSVRIDVFDGDQRDFTSRPSVLALHQLEAPGAFTLQVPQSAQRVWLSAFNDANENGRPDPEDPTGFYGRNPLGLSDLEIDGVILELEVRAPPPDRL